MANAYDNYHGAGSWDNYMSIKNKFDTAAAQSRANDPRRITQQQQSDGWLQKNIWENGGWRPLTAQDGYGAQGGPTVGAGMGQQPQFQGGAQTQPYGGYLGGAGQGGGAGMQPGMAYAGGSNTFNEGGGMSAAVMPGTGPLMGTGGQWGTSAGTSGTTNPYLSNMADEIGRRSQQGLDQSFNAIRSNAIGVGGLGGSRQGVAQGVATGMANDALTGNLANLYGTDWTNSKNRELSRYGMDQGFYTAERSGDRADTLLGADLYSRGMQGQWSPLQNAGQIYNPLITGMGTTTNNQSSGGGVQGAIGGAMGAYDFYKNLTK